MTFERIRFYILDHHKIVEVDDRETYENWAIENLCERQVGCSELALTENLKFVLRDNNTGLNFIRILTLFKGDVYPYDAKGKPLLFSTKWSAEQIPHNNETLDWRYSTWEEAEIGHEKAVKLAHGALKIYANPITRFLFTNPLTEAIMSLDFSEPETTFTPQGKPLTLTEVASYTKNNEVVIQRQDMARAIATADEELKPYLQARQYKK